MSIMSPIINVITVIYEIDKVILPLEDIALFLVQLYTKIFKFYVVKHKTYQLSFEYRSDFLGQYLLS